MFIYLVCCRIDKNKYGSFICIFGYFSNLWFRCCKRWNFEWNLIVCFGFFLGIWWRSDGVEVGDLDFEMRGVFVLDVIFIGFIWIGWFKIKEGWERIGFYGNCDGW